jgi:3-phytase
MPTLFSYRRSAAGLIALFVIAAAMAVAAGRGDREALPVVRPLAVVQTTPVPHGGDSADDPAIWIHPSEAEKSLVLGTDKHGGLVVYDMEGHPLETVSEGCRPDNVDVLYGFALGGKKVDLAVAGCRGSRSLGLKIWRIDSDTRRLTDVTAGGAIEVFGHGEPYGTGVYHSAKTGRFYVFVNDKHGHQEQYELQEDGLGKVTGRRVRAFRVGSVTEGCVCDDEAGFVYVAEERRGIWKFPAEPDGGEKGTLIAKVGEHGLHADVEGLTLYCAAGGKGYLIASSQGNNTYKVYTREGENRFVCTIDPKKGAIDDVSDTDGIAVTNQATSARFSKGLFIVQDGSNKGGKQNFKMYRWEDIAGTELIIDTGWNVRRGAGNP